MNPAVFRLSTLTGLALLASLPFTAFADSQLERFEDISERANDVMMDVMVREYAAMGMDEKALRAAMPEGAWDDEYREAGQCMLDRYAALIGHSGVDDMLDQMDELFASIDPETATMESMSALGDMSAIAGVSTEQQAAITSECGFVELGMRRMRESGFMELLQSQMMRDAGG